MKSKITWKPKTVAIETLQEWEDNPRQLSKEQYKQLKDSLDEFGQVEPIVANLDDVLIGGHQRLRTLKEMGETHVEVNYPDTLLDAKQIRRLNIRLNKNTGSWDYDILGDRFDQDELLELGFTSDELDLGDDEAIDLGGGEEEEPPEPPKEPETVIGDVYELNGHRLVCGDCRQADVVKKALNATPVDMLMTDPPYGVNYSDKNALLNKVKKGNSNQTRIENDNIDDYRQFFSEFLSIVPMSDYNTAYVFMNGQELHNLRLAFEDAGFYWSDYLVWVKNNHVLGRKDYNAKHDFCMYGWKGKHKFYGPTNAVTTLEFDKPQSSKLHPTMKPIELIGALIDHGSQKTHLVYDPFSGSGTTLLACEKLGRRFSGVELSPAYCDVIVERWEKYMKEQNRPYEILRNGKKQERM